MKLIPQRYDSARRLAEKDIEGLKVEIKEGDISYTPSEVWMYLRPILVKGNKKLITHLKSIGFEFDVSQPTKEGLSYIFYKKYKV